MCCAPCGCDPVITAPPVFSVLPSDVTCKVLTRTQGPSSGPRFGALLVSGLSGLLPYIAAERRLKLATVCVPELCPWLAPMTHALGAELRFNLLSTIELLC